MADFRYVFSAPAMLRLNKSSWENDNPVEFEVQRKIIEKGIKKIQDDVRHAIPGHTFNIDLLFNAYTERDMGPRFNKLDNFGFEKLYADSGGLQIVSAGLSVDDSLKAGIYKIQSNADYGMCFDEIPCGNATTVINTKSNRSQTSNKVYYADRNEACATKTAHNIREQIEVLDGLDAKTKIFYIVQGNTYNDMVEWFDYGTKVLQPSNYNRLAGLAIADTCMGNGPKESIDMLAAYHLIHKKFGQDKIKKSIHMLGVGSVKRLLPIVYMEQAGFLPKDLTISFDSTSFSMSYFMGRFLTPNGTKIDEGTHNYTNMFNDVWDYFKDIYLEFYPTLNKEKFVEHVVTEIRSVAGTINNSQDVYANVMRANITLTCVWQTLGFVHTLKEALANSKFDNSEVGRLQSVKNWDEFKEWEREFGKRVVSKRISRENSNPIDAWFV